MQRLLDAALLVVAIGCTSSATAGADDACVGDCVGGHDTGVVTEAECPIQPTWPSIQSGYFQPTCNFITCHGGDAVNSRLPLGPTSGYDALVGVDSLKAPGTLRVAPGDPDKSFLVWKLEGTLGADHGQIMPPSATVALDPSCRIRRIREWIEAGAPRSAP